MLYHTTQSGRWLHVLSLCSAFCWRFMSVKYALLWAWQKHTHAHKHVCWDTKKTTCAKQGEPWLPAQCRARDWCCANIQIPHLINVYITVANAIRARPWWERSRSSGKPTWVDNRLRGSRVHSPVNWTHQEGLRGGRKKNTQSNYETQFANSGHRAVQQSNWKFLENLLSVAFWLRPKNICSPHTD